MGLRVTRYMPAVTREEVFCGFSGLTVVFARRNAAMPARLKQPPAKAIDAVTTWRTTLGSSMDAPILELPHIAAATSSATSGGGTLSSNEFMCEVRSREAN
jgi:hypothetical protein